MLEVKKRKIKSKLKSAVPGFWYRLRDGKADFLKVGFPKSGNNWVHFLISNAIAREGGKEVDIHFRNKADWVSTSKPQYPPVEGFPRLLSNTDSFDEQVYVTADTIVVYILRHPADVLDSHYHYLKHRWGRQLGTFSEYIRSEEFGIDAWVSHVESWEGRWDHLVKFEELKDDPLQCLKEIVRLLEYEFTTETLEYAVKQSSFENMAAMEEEYGLPRKQGANMDYSFMRKGTTDQGKEYFDAEDYQYLSTRASDVIERFQYEIPS